MSDEVDTDPVTAEDRRVGDCMTAVSKVIDEHLHGEYGGVIVFLKLGGPKGDPPHDFYIQSPMADEMIIWALEQALEQCNANAVETIADHRKRRSQ